MRTFMFPGQGSHAKGMGAGLFDEFKDYTEKADKILGFSIKTLCLEDPKRQLNKTQFTQPALYVVNALSYLKKIQETGEKPDYVVGHSLGEFDALFAAECFDFEVGLKLVKKRGELMSEASGGAMAAILNASQSEVENILKKSGLDGIDVANFNTPTQIVISGPIDQIGQAQEFFQSGSMLYYPLNTSGAFHSRYMKPARDKFESYLKRFKFSAPKIPVIANVSAKPYEENEIVTQLANQMCSSVRWTDSIKYLSDLGGMTFEEIGHGDVLTKLVAKILLEQVAPTIDEVKATPPMQSDVRADSATVAINANISTEPSWAPSGLDVKEKVDQWNQRFPLGTQVKCVHQGYDLLETRTQAMVLFGHRAVVYIKGYQGYFALDELKPIIAN